MTDSCLALRPHITFITGTLRLIVNIMKSLVVTVSILFQKQFSMI